MVSAKLAATATWMACFPVPPQEDGPKEVALRRPGLVLRIEEVQSAGGAAYVLRTKLSTDIIPAITEALADTVQVSPADQIDREP